MIKVENVIYDYPGKRALKDVSFHIKEGSITALVGPNGAGKTTLMRCIAALDKPFSGSISVANIDVFEDPREVHRQIGYLSDFFGLYDDLTVRQCLTFMANIHHFDPVKIPAKVEETAKKLYIDDYLDNYTSTLSRGLKQRLGIAQALIHDPKVLLLDEPASGLDPEARVKLSKLFIELQKQGLTMIISSHILAELEDYCTDMLLIRDGKIIEHCDAKSSTQLEKQSHKIVIELTEQADDHKEIFESHKQVSNLKTENEVIEFIFEGTKAEVQALLKKATTKKVPIFNFSVQKKKLQDIYMDYAQGGPKK